MQYKIFNFNLLLVLVILIKIIFFIGVFGCAKKNHSTDNIDISSMSSDITDHQTPLQQILTVDPAELQIISLQASNQPTGNYFSNVIINVVANSKTQYYKIKICDPANPDKTDECNQFVGYQSSYQITAERLVNAPTISIKVTPCLSIEYSTKPNPCGTGKTISHQRPTEYDPVLTGLYGQRTLLHAQAQRWDQQILQKLTEHQASVSQCLENNKDFQQANINRTTINMLVNLLGSFIPPSQQFSTHTDFGDLQQLSDLVTGKSFDQIQQLIDNAGQYGHDGYKLVALLRYYQAGKQIHQLGQYIFGDNLLNQINAIVGGKIGDIFSPSNLDGLANQFFGAPTGSAIGFISRVGNAIYDLNATNVFLPCDQQQTMIDSFNREFASQLSTFRKKICQLNDQINDKRKQLKLNAESFDGESC